MEFKNLLLRLFVLPFILHEPVFSTSIDLDALRTDFVLEAKKIEIEGYPDAFNPSIIRWDGSILMCFRIRDPITAATNQIGYLWLDDEFNPTSPPKILDLKINDSFLHTNTQDPRLIFAGGNLYIVFNDMVKMLSGQIRRMFISKLYVEGDRISILDTECILHFQKENIKRDEKNWAPFEYNGKLLLTYSINPLIILKPLPGTEKCETVSSNEKQIQWDWGELRGGTPALLHEGEYLGFFHSSKEMKTLQSKEKKISHYFIGAYTFTPKPPFSISKITPLPIVGENFYNGPEYKTWKPLRVVFPGGYIFDESSIWIAYGKQDHEVWVVKLCKKALLENLVTLK